MGKQTNKTFAQHHANAVMAALFCRFDCWQYTNDLLASARNTQPIRARSECTALCDAVAQHFAPSDCDSFGMVIKGQGCPANCAIDRMVHFPQYELTHERTNRSLAQGRDLMRT